MRGSGNGISQLLLSSIFCQFWATSCDCKTRRRLYCAGLQVPYNTILLPSVHTVPPWHRLGCFVTPCKSLEKKNEKKGRSVATPFLGRRNKGKSKPPHLKSTMLWTSMKIIRPYPPRSLPDLVAKKLLPLIPALLVQVREQLSCIRRRTLDA